MIFYLYKNPNERDKERKQEMGKNIYLCTHTIINEKYFVKDTRSLLTFSKYT